MLTMCVLAWMKLSSGEPFPKYEAAVCGSPLRSASIYDRTVTSAAFEGTGAAGMARAGVGSGRRPTGNVRRGAAVRTGAGLGVGGAVGATVGRAVGVGTGDGVAGGATVALGLGLGEAFEVLAGDGVTEGDAAGVGACVGDAVGEGAMFATVFCFFGAFAKRANAMPKNHPAITTTTAAAMVIAQPFPPPDERRGPDGVSRRRRPRSSSFTLK